MKKRFLLGIDKGTSMIKVGLIDFSGNEISTERQPVPVINLKSDWHEEDLNLTWQSTGKAIRKLIKESGILAEEIAAIGITGNMTGALLIDSEGNPVRNGIGWPDGRGIEILNHLENSDLSHRFFKISGNAPTGGMTLVILRWLMEYEPEVVSRARYLIFSKDWIRYKLTGNICTDESDISHMPGDISKRTYSTELFELLEISGYMRLIPPIQKSIEIVGGVTKDASEFTGLIVDTPVVCGLGDAVANCVGTGVVLEGQAASVLGTSAMNIIVTEKPDFFPINIGFGMVMVEGRWIRVLPNYGGGTINLDWMIKTICSDEVQKSQKNNQGIFDILEKEISAQTTGANGVIFHPYLTKAGVVAPFYNQHARAQFFGISTTTSRADLLRSIYEGVAFSIRDCFSIVPTMINEIRLTGGGANSPTWCQIIADCLGVPVHIPSGSESGILGAAITAGVGTGVYSDFASATATTIRIQKTYKPNPLNFELYTEVYELYKTIREDLDKRWHQHAMILEKYNYGKS